MKSKILTLPSRPAIMATLLVLAFCLGLGAHHYQSNLPIPSAHAETAAPSPSGPSLPDFADIAARQGPSVVNISVEAKVKAALPQFPGFPQMRPDDPFYEFFRRFQIPEQQNEVPSRGLGSGFIVSTDGVVLTNAHVVDGADEVTVKLTDKREFKAKVKGVDKLADVAVLKIDADNLPAVKIGDPQKARVGEWVIAIGSPFGFENSVTAGIISAKSRSLPNEGYVPFLQTDVAVNPGNSGGPLFNTAGEVIGINSQIYSRSGGYQGLSFAIPIDVAMKVERQLMERGKVSRGRLGVMIQEVSQQLADTFGLEKPRGALVSTVEPDSPAEKAGIEAGDIILSFNGKDIARSADLPPLVADMTPGEQARLELWHKGKTKEITMTVGELQPEASGKIARQNDDRLGLSLRPLTPEERKRAGTEHGLLVEIVDQGGPASRAGIHPGDIILAANSDKLDSVQEFRAQLAKSNYRAALLILRNGQRIFVPIRLE